MTQEERDEMRRKTKLMFGRSWGALTLMMALVALVTLLGAGTALAANHWTDITDQQWVNDYGVTAAQVVTVAAGYPDGTFQPGLAVNRGQFAKMAVTGLGLATANPLAATFSDVPITSYYFPWVEGASAAKVISGFGDGTFRPSTLISRQQADSILGLFLSQKELMATGHLAGTHGTYSSLSAWYAAEGATILAGFADAGNLPAADAPASAYLVFHEVVQGSSGAGGTYLSPGASLTRAQAVALILRAQAAVPAAFTPAASMNKARGYFTATQLTNGNILVAGGYSGNAAGPPSFFPDAEIYNWLTGTWNSVAPMNHPRAAAVAMRLPGGKVLVAGGTAMGPSAGTAEIYNPATNTWTDTGPLNVPRFEDMAVAVLPGGRVLVAGGFAPNITGQPPFTPLASTEIWDPATNQWTLGNPMHAARGEFASVTLKDGRVLVTGGTDATGAVLKSAEIYDPQTGQWSLTGDMTSPRRDAAAVVLADGRVLVAGGADASGQPTKSSEIYDPGTGTWTTTGNLNIPRSEAEDAIVLLPSGQVLLAGGYYKLDDPAKGVSEDDVNTAEVYDPGNGTWTPTTNTMSSPRSGHAAVLLGNGGVLVMGGAMGPATATADIFR
jgi:N-acetylneuraminic acid mutarotase